MKKNKSKQSAPAITDKMVVDATLLEITLNTSFESLDMIEFDIQDTKKRLSHQAIEYKKMLGTIKELLVGMSEKDNEDKAYIYEGTNKLLEMQEEMKLDEVSWFLLVNSAIARFFGRMKPLYISWEDYKLAMITKSMTKRKAAKYTNDRKEVFLSTINKMHQSIKGISLGKENKAMVDRFVKQIEEVLDIQVVNQ